MKQFDKVRPIDDLAESLVNATFGATNKIELGGLDELAIMARTMLEAVADDRTVKLELANGDRLEGTLHESMTTEQARALSGRTLDLESAYKKLLVAQASLWARWDCQRRPSGQAPG